MGILDFLKKFDTEEAGGQKSSEENPENQQDIDISFGQEEMSVYDVFGREEKINKQKWITTVLDSNIKANWDDAEGLATVILDAFSKKIYPETREACLRLYSIDENKERKINILSTYYTKIGKDHEAVDLYERYLFRSEGTEAIFLNYAKILELMGRKEEAEKKYLEALKFNPNSKKPFNKYFNMLKKGNREKYNKNLSELCEIDGMWRAKLLMAMTFFENGDKEKGDFYLMKALEESGYNDEVMGLASAIYIMNDLYEDFENNIVEHFQAEKQGVYTYLNILEYYKIRKNYQRGLELCRISSKFNWDKFLDKFVEYEENFYKMRDNNSEGYNNGDINKENSNKVIFVENPLWYESLKEASWLVAKKDVDSYNILALPFVYIDKDAENKKIEEISYGIPIYLHEILQNEEKFDFNFFGQVQNQELFTPKNRYSREYMNLIKKQNEHLDFIFSGNIQVATREIEIYLYDFAEQRKITLINEIYDEDRLYKIINKVIFELNNLFSLNIGLIFEENNNNLYLYAKKLCKKTEGEEQKFYKAWEYKKMLKDQINIVLDDRKNEMKKIELIALLYEISRTNSQLLKSVKPVIYNMIEQNFFNTNNLKLLLPLIFNVYKDENNYIEYVENLSKENFEFEYFEYVDWLNKFIQYAE